MIRKSLINTLMTLMINRMYFVNFMVMVYPASRLISLPSAICSVSVTRVQVRNYRYMYSLQLAFITLLQNIKDNWLASATTLSLNAPISHSHELCKYDSYEKFNMDMFITSQCQFISNNSICSEKPRNQDFQPCRQYRQQHAQQACRQHKFETNGM